MAYQRFIVAGARSTAERMLDDHAFISPFCVRRDFGIGEPRVVVDRQMHIFPADPARIALAGPVAGDPAPDPIELAELPDVDVDDLAGGGPFIATDRFGRLESRQAD